MRQIPNQMASRDWGLLVTLSIVWGGSFFFAEVAIKELPPLTIVLVRVMLGAAVLLPFLWINGRRLPVTVKGWIPFFSMGLLNNVIPFSLLVTGQLICSSLVMLVLACLFERPWTLPMPGVTTWLCLIGLAVVSTAFAYILFFRILERSGAANVSLVTLLVPVTAILLGASILDEIVRIQEITGALVIASALLIIDGRVFGWLRPGSSKQA